MDNRNPTPFYKCYSFILIVCTALDSVSVGVVGSSIPLEGVAVSAKKMYVRPLSYRLFPH